MNSDYCDYLRQFDSRVPYNSENKELTPFVGILCGINESEYFAPLSSPKEKHKKMSNGIDFLKIDNGNLGAVNFNNMIPVGHNNYNTIYFKDEWTKHLDKKYQELLKNQVNWLNANYSRL